MEKQKDPVLPGMLAGGLKGLVGGMLVSLDSPSLAMTPQWLEQTGLSGPAVTFCILGLLAGGMGAVRESMQAKS